MKSTLPLSIRDLSFRYRSRNLFSNVNLDVAPGEFVTIMGENGSGKSTLIDCLMGQLQPASGQIQFWGDKNEGRARYEIQDQVGWVLAQKESYAPWLKIQDVISSLRLLYPRWNDQLFSELAGKFKVDLDGRIGTLSSGEASKFRLLKAVAFEPRLLILDELTANLSPESKSVMIDFLLDRFTSGHLSVLYVCHSVNEALRLSDRIYTLTTQGLLEGAVK